MSYNVVINNSAEKELRSLSSDWRGRIVPRLMALGEDPHPGQSIRLRGSDNFRLRIGDYRVLYSIDETNKVISILAIGHRRDVYRSLS